MTLGYDQLTAYLSQHMSDIAEADYEMGVRLAAQYAEGYARALALRTRTRNGF